MHAMLVNEKKELVWTEVPDPTMGPDEVVVDIHAAAVNRADLLQRQGKYPPPPGAPEWMGLEASGVISRMGESVAAAGRWNVGDKMCALLAGGGYAEKVAVRAEVLAPVPAGLTMEEAASLPEVFSTAYLNLVIEADVKEGETVLIHAGASGVGIAAIQIAKYLGARVVTTVGSEAKARAVAAIGADVIVDRTAADLDAVLDDCQAQGRPVDVVLDCLGGEDLGRQLLRLARGGRWILIATLAGEYTRVPLRALLKGGLRLIGSTLRSRPLAVKAQIIEQLTRRIWPAIESGSIRPAIHRVLPIDQAEQAHAILERRENIGKVVLQVAN